MGKLVEDNGRTSDKSRGSDEIWEEKEVEVERESDVDVLGICERNGNILEAYDMRQG